MPTVAFCGDTHGYLTTMWDALVAWQDRTGIQLDWAYQVGDFGIWPDPMRLDPMTRKHSEATTFDPSKAIRDCLLGDYQVPIPTYFTRGNHEDQEFLRLHERNHMALFPEDFHTRPIKLCPNLFYVPDSYVIELDGIRIASWGGCFGKRVWEKNIPYWGNKENPEHQRYRSGRYLNHMTQDSFETLMRSEFDILVTHDAPTGCGLGGGPIPEGVDPDEVTDAQMEGAGVRAIRDLIEEKQPRYQINGHWHTYRRNIFGRTTAIVLDLCSPTSIESKHWVEFLEL